MFNVRTVFALIILYLSSSEGLVRVLSEFQEKSEIRNLALENGLDRKY